MPLKLTNIVHSIRLQLQSDRTILILNGLVLLGFLSLTIYAKFWSTGQLIELLFGAPFNKEHPYFGMLTTLSNLLLCLSVSICMFSIGILRHLHPKGKIDWFIACFAIIFGIILLDRMFRLTIILVLFGSVRKLLMFFLYGMAAALYGSVFRRRLFTTPYFLLLGALALFAVGGVVDLTHLPGQGLPAMLEDGSTLLASLNIALYIWYVCRQALIEAFDRRSLVNPLANS